MKKKSRSLFFDKNDYQLLEIVNEVVADERQKKPLRSLLVEYMHPQGIKELAAPRGLRIAYTIASLLDSFEKGQASNRINALRSLRDEVLQAPTGFYRKNSGRLLVQIMKELVRHRGNKIAQLKLAHDFRMVSTGNPRLIRSQLAKYHLLEMPEEWNQYAFDDHVHDANTKGRKSPTHLIMDAWIKGIRYLTVVYYNYVTPEMVAELIEASSLLDIHLRVGIEMSARFRDKYVRFTWEPHKVDNHHAFMKFLEKDAVQEIMEEGKEVSRYQQRYVLQVLEQYNIRHRHILGKELEMELPPLASNDFLKFVGGGQPSVLHLGRFIHNSIAAAIHEGSEDTEDVFALRQVRFSTIGVERIIEDFLQPACNPDLENPYIPGDDESLPHLLHCSPQELMQRLLQLHSSSRFSLRLGNLSVQDVLELIYDCRGLISHIEAYNLKNASHGIVAERVASGDMPSGEAVALKSPSQHYRLIANLQQALNEDNVIALKRAIRDIIWDYEEQYVWVKKQAALLIDKPEKAERLREEEQLMTLRKGKLMEILYHLEALHKYYEKRSLGSRIGSSSTGQAEHWHGMGLVVMETLPKRARKAVLADLTGSKRLLIPVTAHLIQNSHSRVTRRSSRKRGMQTETGFLPSAENRQWTDWTFDEFRVHPGIPGNIATLGGLHGHRNPKSSTEKEKEKVHPWKYLNTNLKNSLKVLFGFLPAFLTFFLTKDWWVLAYCGAVIWFGITGLRNILQSVLGGGGLRRSPLLPWNSLVSWSRISDSLLYTGFSVPLLDYLVKTVLLDHGMGVTTATNPILLYAVMGLANGIYISSHNIFRGLPRNAAVGNFFRSILAIPLAILFNSLVGTLLAFAGVPDVSAILQKWAAILSKLASDCVAALIEGIADRQGNIHVRLFAYRMKISQLFAVYARLEVLFPEEDVLEMLQSPKMMLETLNYETKELEKLVIVNGLDLMYFWMYQPRSERALQSLLHRMSEEEWLIFYRLQLVLKRYQEISGFFVDGLVGKNFSKALSFYLDRHE